MTRRQLNVAWIGLLGLSISASAVAAPPSVDEWFGDRIREASECKGPRRSWYDTPRLKGCLEGERQIGVWQLWNVEEKRLEFLLAKEGEKLEGPAMAFLPGGEVGAIMTHKQGELVGERTAFWVNGQIREVQTYRDDGSGKQEGPQRRYAPHGALTLEATWVDGQLDGDYVEWNNGCVKTKQGRFVAGKEEGLFFTWSDRGILLSEGSYAAGQRVGVWKFLDEESGTLVEEGPFVDGLRDGVFTEYFTNAYRWREVTWVKGKRQAKGVEACEAAGGVWRVEFGERAEGCYKGEPSFGSRIGTWSSYYETGEIRRRETYVEGGVLDGPYEEFHKTGEQLVAGRYKRGVPDGVFNWKKVDGTSYGVSTIADGEGEWEAFYPDGKPRERGRWIMGRQRGEWMTWYENGNPSEKVTYAGGVEDGPMARWYNTGELKVEGAHAAGNRSETWTAYYANGRVAWRGAYDEAGNRTGPWENFYWEGGLKAKGNHLLDNEDGIWSFYYETGELSAEGPMLQGKRHGAWRFFWKNGEVWREVVYEDGVEVGTGQGQCEQSGGQWVQMVDERAAGCEVCRWKARDEAGQGSDAAGPEVAPGEIPAEAPPIEAPPVEAPPGQAPPGEAPSQDVTPVEVPVPVPGVASPANAARGEVVKAQEQQWIFWYPNGKKEKEGFYDKGMAQGEWTFWYENGQVMLKGRFVDGIEDGRWEGFYPDGTRRFAGEFIKGEEHGAWTVFSAAGAPLMEGHYEAGKKVGAWTYYDAAGKKRDAGTFENDEETGTWKAFWPSGAVRSEGAYAAGKRTGEWVWYREDGTVWRKATYVDGKEQRPRR